MKASPALKMGVPVLLLQFEGAGFDKPMSAWLRLMDEDSEVNLSRVKQHPIVAPGDSYEHEKCLSQMNYNDV